ncbi:VCBS repeat-containing protein [Clostridium neuense]|uniref:VCBS repeat-containing protein n=1 Tax=Clostridium neuense TaxID=1728934 RepID=A0ABW8TB59_9CLOT
MFNCGFRENNMICPRIVSYKRGDVNGDGIPDNVYLTGTKKPDSPFIQDITLIIQDGASGRLNKVQLSENAGYDPALFLGDFTGDGVKDILISIFSGGSGAFMYDYIYTFTKNVPKLIFDFNEYNEEYKYEITYKDNYKVEAISRKNNEKYIIDISTRDSGYLSEIYYDNGVLKQPISGFVNPLSGLYPVDYDLDGVYELLAYQKIAGRYNADALGYFLNVLKWKDNKFDLYNQNVAIFGVQV